MIRKPTSLALLALLLGACGSREPAPCSERVSPIAEGFGARGPHAVRVETIPNPRWPPLTVSVFLPADAAAPVPVILFAHAYDNATPARYRALLEHIASRGYAVVFSPYMVDSQRHADRYDALWSGIEAALRVHAERLDPGRLGIVGHSYGAGAGPFLALRALRDAGLGRAGAFLYLMAPWFPLQADPGELAELPVRPALLVQVFEEDDAVDPRIASDLVQRLAAGVSERDSVLVRSDANGGCTLPANHAVPQSTGLGARDDALDVHAVFRLLDALAAYAFHGDAAGRRVALGRGSAEQRFMGTWDDGTPVRPLVSSPEPAHPEAHYLFRASDRERWLRYGEPSVTPGAGAPGP